MLLRQVVLVAVAVGVTGQVLAQEASPAEPASPRAATPAPPPAEAKAVQADAAKPVAASSAETAKTTSSLEGELDADKIIAMQKAGYRIKNENGKVLLCRQDLQTGSRLRKTTSCLTAREWDQLNEDNKLLLKAIERTPRAGNR